MCNKIILRAGAEVRVVMADDGLPGVLSTARCLVHGRSVHFADASARLHRRTIHRHLSSVSQRTLLHGDCGRQSIGRHRHFLSCPRFRTGRSCWRTEITNCCPWREAQSLHHRRRNAYQRGRARLGPSVGHFYRPLFRHMLRDDFIIFAW